MAERTPLPNRRLKTSYGVTHNGLLWRVDFGWDLEGKIREFFVAPAMESNKTKPDSERMREIEDGMIKASFLLQTIDDVESLAGRFVRASDPEPLTLFERVCRLAVKIEALEGGAARMAYRVCKPTEEISDDARQVETAGA